jgi:all-trans-retinol 13,14-reductase
MFDIVSDGQLKWHKMDDNYDRIIFPDQSYNFNAPYTRFIDDMVEYFPGTEDKFQEYIRIINKSVKSGLSYNANKALPNWLSTLTYNKMTKTYFKYSDRTTRDVIMGIFNNEQILGVLTGQWGDYGLPPSQSSFAMHAAVVRHYLDGGNYPIGTSRRIAETATDYIEKKGGNIYVNAGVDEIITHNGKSVGVRLNNGDEIKAPIVISSAGIMNTFGKFLRLDSKFDEFNNKLKKITPTFSYYSLYIGLNKSTEELKLKNTNLWIYPGYDHDKNVSDYFNDSSLHLPVVYISFPSAKNPAATKKHPGHSTMEAITVANWNDFSKWEDKAWKNRGNEYEKFKENISQQLLQSVYKHVPQAKEALDYYELSTPLTVNSLANYPQGEMYGLEHTPERFRQRWLRPQTDIKNLYLTGQDMLTVGVTSAMLSGVVTVSAILKKNLIKELIG